MIESRLPSTPRERPTLFMSTAHAPPGEELDYWHAMARDKLKNFSPLHFKKVGDEPFRGEIFMPYVGDLAFGQVEISPHVMERKAPGISGGDPASIFFFVMAGSIESTQGGMHLRSGGGALTTADRLCSYVNREPLRLMGLRVPNAMMDCCVDKLKSIADLDLSQHSALFPLLNGYLAQLARLTGSLDIHTAGRVGRNLADLVNAVVAEVTRSSPSKLPEYKNAALMRVLSFVDEQLDNPEFNPAVVAQALRLSPRYINRLLEEEGTSLGRLIWQRRLERIARDLRDPALATCSISMIAMAHGFSDLSHFSKAFRRRYAMPPRDFRHARGSMVNQADGI